MRNLSFLLVGFFIIFSFACRENPSNPSTEAVNGAPLFLMNRNGTSLSVTGVEISGTIVKISLKATNGSGDNVSLGGYDPPILRDNTGIEYQTKVAELDLLPLTVNDLQIEFLGKVPSAAKTFSLTINSKSSSIRQPRFVLENIPVPNSGKADFAAGQNPPNLTFDDKSVNHPNGTSLTVQQINFGENTIDAVFQIVNGSGRNNEFYTRNERSFLEDDKSNRYFLIPPANGSELKIGNGEKMSGTFRFAGRIAPGATGLSLHLNEIPGGDNQYSSQPKMAINDIQIKK